MLNRLNVFRQFTNKPAIRKASTLDIGVKVDKNKVTVKAVYTGDFTALDGIEYQYFRDGKQIHSSDVRNENPNPVDLLAEFRAIIAEVKRVDEK